ncbi:hypothetical protein [Streptomyces griseoloalbus]|uniref:Uncharacterized protein n=1 Tax=Streptomyces griseoloalbus TaxID=67303 RepID=A0A7W8BL42_9ACTN|nr:hypothetical protein [Streptomyces albaduncus]MBB5125331.1 hypothetical protein [Streptomyces albaduncus]GGW28431.1 hypothetical protein GCM10010340_02470 [Streptomyces albaduncus]
MSDGGVAGQAEAETRPGRFARLRRHWLLTSALALALLATATTVPLVLADSGDDAPCQDVPASTRALAKDPAAATRALDPGDDMARYPAVRKLIRQENPCGDGARALGALIEAATRADRPGAVHTVAQARAAYAVVAALDWAEVPDGMAPGLARMLADYVVDEARYLSSSDDAAGPAVTSEQAAPDREGWTRYGRFLAPGEAHADFEYTDPVLDASTDPDRLIEEVARNPEAFAVLYDAERAYFAHYLERLTSQGGDPDSRREDDPRDGSAATTWPDNDLEDIAGRIGALMRYRAAHTRDGQIPDLAAFDRAVRQHTRGAYRPAERRLTTRPPMGDIAGRPVSGPLRGDLADGRHQLLTVLDAWAESRNVPEARAAAMGQIIDNAYVRGLWLSV